MDFLQAQDAPGHQTERAGAGAFILADEPSAPWAVVEMLFVERERPAADGAGMAEDESAQFILRVIAGLPDAAAGSHANLLFGS